MPKSNHGLGKWTAALAIICCAASLHAQVRDADPLYRAHVKLVEVTIEAQDGRGRHVPDLSQSELSIRAGGRERDMKLFQPVQVALGRFVGVSPLKIDYAPAAHIPEQPDPPRYYLLLFHEAQFTIGTFQRARDAAVEFVSRRMLPNDHVSVVCYDKQVDSQLDFTTDMDAVLRTLQAMRLKHRNIKMQDDFLVYLQNLSYQLAELPGKAVIILISEGMKGIAPMQHAVYERTIRLLQAADVRVYGVDTGGLNLKDPGATIARYGPAIDSLVNQSFNLGLYSAPTGGRYFRYHNDIEALFERVDYEMSAWYVVGFYVDENEVVDSPMRIEITTTRPGVELFYKEKFMPELKDQEGR